MKTQNRLLYRLCAALLLLALTLGLLPAAAAEKEPQWDENKVYTARIAEAGLAGGELVRGAWQSVDVKVIDGCLMVNFLWLQELFDLPYASQPIEDAFGAGTLWEALDPEGAAFAREDGAVMTFCVRKEADSALAIYFASGIDTAVVFTPYTGLTELPLATAPVWDREAEKLTVWVPLSDLMFLLDASCMYDGTGIVLYPPETTVLDLLSRPPERLNRYYSDIFTESGMDELQLYASGVYKNFYDISKSTLQDLSKLNLKGAYNAVFGDKVVTESGRQLAYEMCTFSQEEYDALVERGQLMSSYYDGNMILLGELSDLLGEGAAEALGSAEQVQQALETLLGQTDAMGERGQTLVQMLLSQDRQVADLAASKAWADKLGTALNAGGFVAGELLSTYITYTNLIHEVNSADQNAARSLQTFLEHYVTAPNNMLTQVKDSLEARAEMYAQDRVDLTDEAYYDTHADALTTSLSNLGGAVATALLPKVASAALVKLQLVSIGWTAAEMAVNHVTGGAFDMLDCLNAGLYGMMLESDARAALDAYTRTMPFTGSITDPVFDWSKLDTYRQLLWVYLKACYVTRCNAIGTWQTEQDNPLYETALAPYFQLNEQILEELDVAANGRLGMTASAVAAHRSAFALENEYFLKAIVDIQNNGGHYVQVGTDVYYWRFDDNSYDEGALFHNFYPKNTGSENATLIRRAPDGTETALCRDNIYEHNLYVLGDAIYYSANGLGGTTGGSQVRAVGLDGGAARTVAEGVIVAMDEGAGTLAYRAYGAATLRLYNPVEGTDQALTDNYLKTLAVQDGILYFTTATTGTSAKTTPILCADMQTGEVWTLCQPEAIERTFEDFASDVQQFEIFGDYAYFSYGYYAGTGYYYQGGYIARVRLDGTGYERLAGSPDLLVGAAFNLRLEDSGALILSYLPYMGDYVEETWLAPEVQLVVPTSARNLTTDETPTIAQSAGPMDQPFLYREEICIYAGIDGEIRTLLTPEDYAALGYGVYDADDSIVIRSVEQVGDYVWFTVDGYARDSTQDMGWRPYYRRLGTHICCKDMDTGAVTIVASW